MIHNIDCGRRKYVLVTAAYNEERYIEQLIESVVAQTHRPSGGVIVSAGPTDRPDEIVVGYARRYEFLQLHRITENHPRSFTAQAHAINAGFVILRSHDFD